jgi:hypothetical protein
MRVLKVVDVVWSIDREPITFLCGDACAKSNRGTLIGSPLLFIRGVMHVKSIRDDKAHQLGAPG